jgi:hypothetical protein
MNRKQRRAAEHAAVRKTLQTVPPTPVVPPPVVTENLAIDSEPKKTTTVSEAQLAANRENAASSTGPKTETGKSICRHNAVKTALTGQVILLPTDDVPAYEKLGQIYVDQYKPVGFEEERLVQSIIDADWRLRRIPSLEAGVYAVGHRELSGSVHADFLEIEIYLKYERELKNLSLQENRIRRNREKDLAQLNQIQSTRKEREALLKRFAAKAQTSAPQQQPQSPSPQTQSEFEIGSVFSTPETPAETPLKPAA